MGRPGGAGPVRPGPAIRVAAVAGPPASTRRHPRRRVLLIAGLVALLTGLAAAGYGLLAPHGPPRPPAAATSGAPTTGHRPSGPAMAASEPTSIAIPAIGVSAPVHPVGLNADGTLQVPPLDQPNLTGWYRGGPTPGENGPAVIVGHVDSARYGASVFFRLGTLKPGDTVRVTRADGSVATFTVQAVEQYPKNKFPTSKVYGPLTYPGLRLITCGGTFNATAGSYRDNIVAYARLA